MFPNPQTTFGRGDQRGGGEATRLDNMSLLLFDEGKVQMEVPQGLNSQMLHNSGALRPTPVSRTSSQSSTTLASQRGRVRSTSWADILDEEDEDLLGHLAGGRRCTCLLALL